MGMPLTKVTAKVQAKQRVMRRACIGESFFLNWSS